MKRQPAGVSLAEAIIACFILTFAMLVSAALYHTALQHSVRIDRKQRAARVAEQRVEEIRSWSRAHHGTNGDLEFGEGFDTFNGSAPDPENPGYLVTTDIQEKRLFSPSSEFEEIYFATLEDENIPDDDPNPQKRTLDQSMYIATITVTWGPSVGERIVTRTLIGDPVRDHGWQPEDADKAIKLQRLSGGTWLDTFPSSLNKNESIDLSAFVEDKDGEKMEHAVITWYVDPDSTGNGIIVTKANTPEMATFVNRFEFDTKPGVPGGEVPTWTGGTVQLVARVRLGGREAFKKTPPISLRD